MGEDAAGYVATFSLTDFRRRTSKVMEAAQHGPVLLTRRGKPAFVVMPVGLFDRLSKGRA